MNFAAAYRQHRPAVAAYLRRRCDTRVELDDAVQETFAQAWKLWSNAPGPEVMCPWLIAIARRVFSHMIRAANAASRQKPDDFGIVEAVEAEQPGIVYIDQLRAHFSRLGPAQAAVLTALSRGETATEIAEARGASLSATTMAISLGRRRLGEMLQQGEP